MISWLLKKGNKVTVSRTLGDLHALNRVYPFGFRYIPEHYNWIPYKLYSIGWLGQVVKYFFHKFQIFLLKKEKYDVADYVHLLGTKENPYPYIKNCDIYVQPSYSEGYCTTTMDAKILHKPIVTTDAPGMREQFVSGENGLIVDAMTPEALFEGIKMLIDHHKLQDKFIENLRKEIYDNSKELKKLYGFIES